MFKFKKSFLFIVAVLICGIGVLNGAVGVAKADVTVSSTAPSATVLSPNGGEKFEVGKTYRIEWAISETAMSNFNVYLEDWGGPAYSFKGRWQIGENVHSAYMDWKVPVDLVAVGPIRSDNTYLIKVENADNSSKYDSSNSFFSIVATTTTPSITVLSPNGGEVWEIGKTYEIKWNQINVDKIAIFLEEWKWEGNNNPDVFMIDNNISASLGKYSWSAGHLEGGFIATTGNYYKIKITDTAYVNKFYTGQVIKDRSDNYFSIVAAGANLPPVISGVSGPTTLKVGETGTWTVKASDPENGQLNYSVIWGDEIISSGGAQLISKPLAYIQTATFTHSYSKAGVYNPIFTITDDYNLSAKTSISVNIGDEKCSQVCKNIGTRSEGWYDSCTDKLIKWENCGGTNECIKEGESLGAVVPDNNKQCCEGLRPYITPGIIGTRGICKKIEIYFPQPTQPTKSDDQINQINTNANQLYNNQFAEILSELKQLRDKIKEQASEMKYLRNLTKGVKELAQTVKDVINNFITYGVDNNTQKLGAGERAAVISSYKSAFDKLPETEAELTDVIKIANGRFPNVTSDKAEKKAKEQFKKIYKKIADMNDANDSAAIKVMAYGLRQKAENRNLNSEKVGIKIFKDIYKFNPSTTEDWNTMQAITYSGAKKEFDTDGDLLPDDREKELGTNPNKADSDGDGFKDGEEVEGGYNPLKR